MTTEHIQWEYKETFLEQKHQPKVVHTTTDGVPMLECDDYYLVDANCNIYYTGDYVNWDAPKLKSFSDKHAAEEYVALNKECLSWNDIEKFLGPEARREIGKLLNAKMETNNHYQQPKTT